MNGYETVMNSVSTEEIRKSRFITVVRRVKSEEELFGELAAIRKEYSDATHVCYASVFDKSGLAARFSDDGEPSGTAGQPILEAIRKSGLKEILVAVVRYFGGIKLGAGGLTRAYSGCASGAIAEAGRVECELCDEYRVSASFATAKKISGALAKKGYMTVNTEYSDKVTFTLAVEAGRDAVSEIAALTLGSASVEKIATRYVERPAVTTDKT